MVEVKYNITALLSTIGLYALIIILTVLITISIVKYLIRYNAKQQAKYLSDKPNNNTNN